MSKSEFAISEVLPGKLNALVKTIMKQTGTRDPNEAVRLVNSGERVISAPKCSWCEDRGVIRFTVTSDGTTKQQWRGRLEGKRHQVTSSAGYFLGSEHFEPTNGVTYEIEILKGKLFSGYDERTSKNFLEIARKRSLSKSNSEVMLLIRDKFSCQDFMSMGLDWILASSGNLSLGCDSSGSWFDTQSFQLEESDCKWSLRIGFAFVVRQLNSEAWPL